jgi:hypothetical protein
MGAAANKRRIQLDGETGRLLEFHADSAQPVFVASLANVSVLKNLLITAESMFCHSHEYAPSGPE